MKTIVNDSVAYCGPLKPQSKAHLLPTRQLWVARDTDGGLFLFPHQPIWNGDQFEPDDSGHYIAHLPEDWFPELEPGFCQVFAKQGPRIDKRIKPDGDRSRAED